MDLFIKAKYWLGFGGNQLLFSINYQDVRIGWAIIVGCIKGKIIVNPREMIAEKIKLRSKKPGTL